MKHIKHYAFLTVLVCLMSLISGCKNQNSFSDNNREQKTENQKSARNEKHSENNEDVDWKEVTENGVDETLLIKNIDKKVLTYVAKQLQNLCDEIGEKGRKVKYYWLTGQWYNDVIYSKQYNGVLLLGKKAMKPLFLIIYKSKQAGMYEWVCSKALDKISGFDFSGLNNGAGWSNSREFLKAFTDKIIEQKISKQKKISNSLFTIVLDAY